MQVGSISKKLKLNQKRISPRHWLSTMLSITLRLPTSTRVFRVKVERAFPLNRMEYFCELFEEASMPLTSQSKMQQLIPFILEEECTVVYKELMSKDVSTVFDATSRDSDALVVLLCFVDNWELKGRFVRFQLVKSSVCGD